MKEINLSIVNERYNKRSEIFEHISYIDKLGNYLILTDTGKNKVFLYNENTELIENTYHFQGLCACCIFWDATHLCYIEKKSNTIRMFDLISQDESVIFNNGNEILWGLKKTMQDTLLVTTKKNNGFIEFDLLTREVIYEKRDARFKEIRGVVKKRLGEYYLLGSQNHCIYQVKDDKIKIFYGKENKPTEEDGLNSPWGIDIKGNVIFVADSRNSRIIAIDINTRKVKMIACNELQREYMFYNYIKRPISVIIKKNKCYFVDSTDNNVKIIDIYKASNLKKIGNDVYMYASCFRYPRSVEWIIENTFVVTDSGNHSVKICDLKSNKVINEIRFGENAWPRAAVYHNDMIFVAITYIYDNYSKCRFYNMDKFGENINLIWSNLDCICEDPHSLFYFNDHFVISDSKRNLVLIISDKGKIKYQYNEIGLIDPHFACINKKELIIADTGNNRIVIIEYQNKEIRYINSYTINGSKYNFCMPRWCGYVNGNYYIIDSGNNDILILNEKFVLVKKVKDTMYKWNRPHYMCFNNNTMWISDFMNNRIVNVEMEGDQL